MDNANIIIVGVGCVCVFALRLVQNFIANGNVLISDLFFHSQYSSDTVSNALKLFLVLIFISCTVVAILWPLKTMIL